MRFKSILAVLLMVVSTVSAMSYSIYPVPRSMTLMGSNINLGSKVNIVTSDADAKYVGRLKEVLENAGLSYTLNSVAASGLVDVYIGGYGSGDAADRYAATLTGLNTAIFPSATGRYDSHIVRIDADNDKGAILLLGDTNGSAYYGCATLEQILEQKPLSALPTVNISDYAHAKYRGIMEGFYGHPYSIESRLNLLEYCKRYKMNYYGYGPKADPYHAGNWRLDYPSSVTDAERNLGQLTASDMADIAAKAKECNVDFVWIIHPSLGSYSINLSWTSDIMTKFEHLYSLGVRHFGVSVDDMSGHPSNQGQLAADVQAAIDAKWNTDGTPESNRVGPVLFTPTVYALNYGSSYVLQSLSSIDSKIDVAFTGYDCFSNVRASSFTTMANYIGRDPVFWWNNPVNDDYDEFLYLHGLTARWTIEQQGAVSRMKGFLLNPMNQGQASKVCLFSGADYAWNPEAFDEQSSWEASLRSIVKTDENVQALRDFIRVMSAYVTRETKTPEGEEYADLYTQFKNCITNLSKNGSESLSQVEELYSVMTRTIEACDKLSAMAESEDDDCRLFLVDIEPWLLKVREMASIIVDTFDALRGDVEYDRWTDMCNITQRASTIHSNYMLSVLEGSGTGTYERFKEVQPTPKHLDALIDFIAQQDLAISLPERDRTPEVVSNFAEDCNRGTIEIDEKSCQLTLSGYGPAFDWIPGLFLGVNFNCLQSVCANDMECPNEFSNLKMQYSVNGKAWIDVPSDPAESVEAAYIRFVNASTSSVHISTGGVVKMPLALAQSESGGDSGKLNITATTNMGTYSSYVLDNILDGNPSTYFYSSSTPIGGISHITLDLGTIAKVSGVALQFNTKDQPSGTVLIQTSDDGATWEEQASFTSADIDGNNRYIKGFSAVDAHYVRMLISTVTTNEWLQVAEFGVTAEVDNETPEVVTETLAVANDHNQQEVRVLDDRNLSTGYEANEAGYLIYNFTENLKIDEVLVFHNSVFSESRELPTISVYADGEWRDCGSLCGVCTHIKTSDYFNIEHLKIEWNEYNLPNICEIMPVGEPFDANKHSGIDSIIKDAPAEIIIEAGTEGVNVESSSPITLVSVYDVAGRVLAAHNVGAEYKASIKIPLLSSAVIIVKVTTAEGNVHSERVVVVN